MVPFATDEILQIDSTPAAGERLTIRWADIVRVAVFKVDLFNPQIVNLVIDNGEREEEFTAADCGGFEGMTALLARFLPGVPDYASWWPRVTDPLLRQGDIVLFTR